MRIWRRSSLTLSCLPRRCLSMVVRHQSGRPPPPCSDMRSCSTPEERPRKSATPLAGGAILASVLTTAWAFLVGYRLYRFGWR